MLGVVNFTKNWDVENISENLSYNNKMTNIYIKYTYFKQEHNGE